MGFFFGSRRSPGGGVFFFLEVAYPPGVVGKINLDLESPGGAGFCFNNGLAPEGPGFIFDYLRFSLMLK